MRVHHFAISLLTILSLAGFTAWGQSNCAPGDANRAAMLALGMQNKLLAHKIAPDDIEMDAPQDVAHDMVMLRKTLDVATQVFFRCEIDVASDPTSIQTELSQFLHTQASIRNNKPNEQDGVYAANLQVHIQATEGFPDSLLVVLKYDIECGDDSLLFLYTKSGRKWQQQLHWYSDKYTRPSDAFGDFFLYKTVPGPASKPLLLIAHGHPWCASRWSGFEMNLLQPKTENVPQANLGHFFTGYDRGTDDSLTIKKTVDGFTIKFWTNEAVAPHQVLEMSGPMTLRFQTIAGVLKCVSKDCPRK